jgi:hypothetical protein
MKGGVDHLVPLSRQAAALFRELKPLPVAANTCFPISAASTSRCRRARSTRCSIASSST